jgi:N-methylhydantoinase A/oxoprolinase/acetone carboxylase beta subunit
LGNTGVTAEDLDGYGAGASTPSSAAAAAAPEAQVSAFFNGEWRDTLVYRRESMRAGQRVEGPAIISDAVGTTVLEPGWAADVTLQGLVMTRVVPLVRQASSLALKRSSPPSGRCR